MAKAYQSGGITACYSVSVSVCKGLTPATVAKQCYVFTNTQLSKSAKNTFWRNTTATKIRLSLLKDAANAAWAYLSAPLFKSNCVCTSGNITNGCSTDTDIISSAVLHYLTE